MVARRRSWLWLALLGVALSLGGWLAWPTPTAPPLPDEPANAAQVLAVVRQGIAAGYVVNTMAGGKAFFHYTQPLVQTLHESYPESTRLWLLRHLLGPGRPEEPGISDYDLCFLAPQLVSSAALRQAVLAEIVVPYAAVAAPPWRQRAIVRLGLELKCTDPGFLRLAYDTQAENQRRLRSRRYLQDMLWQLDEWCHSGQRLLGHPPPYKPLLSASYWRQENWRNMTQYALYDGRCLVPAATFIALWAMVQPEPDQYAPLLRALRLSMADERLVRARLPAAEPYLRPGQPLTPMAYIPHELRGSVSLMVELQARQPRLQADWARASTAAEAVAVMPALILLANEGDSLLAEFFQRWPDYYYQPPADGQPSRYGGQTNRFKNPGEWSPKPPAEQSLFELMESLRSLNHPPPAFQVGYCGQMYLEYFWPAEQEFLARAPAWRPLAQTWRTHAGRPWPPELWAQTWDAARERLHATPDARAAQYAGLLLAHAWTLTDPRAAEQRFHPDWPEHFGGPMHRWCAAALAADLLPEHTDAGDYWVQWRRLSEGQGLPKAIAWERLLLHKNYTMEFFDLGYSDRLMADTHHLMHPSLYGEQAWLDCRRWLASQGKYRYWPLLSLAQCRGTYTQGVFDNYLQYAKDSGLDADRSILPQPYYEHLLIAR